MDAEQRTLRYLDTIRQLESEADQLRDLERVLRRLSRHLCISARGHGAPLDEVLAELDHALKTEEGAGASRFEPFIARLQTAMRSVESSAPVTDASPDAEDCVAPRVIIDALLQHLPPIPGLREALERVLDPLHDDPAPRDWTRTLSGMVDVLSEQCLRMQRERDELESFLKQVTDRLGELAAYLVGQEDALDSARGDGAVLETRIREEIQGLRAGMADAASPDDMRALVDVRLDAIGEHVQRFREAEVAHCREHKSRAEHMRQRVAQLEAETGALRRTMEDERRRALVDQLTGIPNRQAFEERMGQEYRRWKRFATPTALVIWDVDNFKGINDSYGHTAGDKVIRAVAQLLHDRVRETDFAARYGGEEFIMLLSGAAGREALAVAEGIRGEVQALGFHFRGDRVPITVSAGISVFTSGDTPEAVFDNADRALYEAKHSGRNRCVLH